MLVISLRMQILDFGALCVKEGTTNFFLLVFRIGCKDSVVEGKSLDFGYSLFLSCFASMIHDS